MLDKLAEKIVAHDVAVLRLERQRDGINRRLRRIRKDRNVLVALFIGDESENARRGTAGKGREEKRNATRIRAGSPERKHGGMR